MDNFRAFSIRNSHPLNVGMVGMHGNYAPNVLTNECDVLIAIGMRFDDRVTGDLSTYAKQAKVIHFEIDPAEIDKNVKTDVAVLGDAKESLKALSIVMKIHIQNGIRNLKIYMLLNMKKLLKTICILLKKD